MDFTSFILSLLSQKWLFFNNDEIVWDGEHHHIAGVQINGMKFDDFMPYVNSVMQGFNDINEVINYLVMFLNDVEQDEGLIIPRQAISPEIGYSALREGNLTGITFANLVACDGALQVIYQSENNYMVVFDQNLANGIPSFFNLASRFLWDMRQVIDSTANAPFSITFIASQNSGTNPYFGFVSTYVAGAQPNPGVTYIQSCPVVGALPPIMTAQQPPVQQLPVQQLPVQQLTVPPAYAPRQNAAAFTADSPRRIFGSEAAGATVANSSRKKTFVFSIVGIVLAIALLLTLMFPFNLFGIFPTPDEETLAIIERIDNIGTVSLDSRHDLYRIRNDLNKLSEEQSALVSNISILELAEETLRDLQVNECIESIDSISEVSLENKKAIHHASALFNSLNDDLKTRVTNKEKLEDAKTRLATLESEQKALEAEQKAQAEAAKYEPADPALAQQVKQKLTEPVNFWFYVYGIYTEISFYDNNVYTYKNNYRIHTQGHYQILNSFIRCINDTNGFVTDVPYTWDGINFDADLAGAFYYLND